MLDGRPRAGGPVDVDPGVVLVGGAPRPAEGGERHPALGQPGGARVAVVGAGEQEAVGLAGVEELGVRGDLALVVVGGEQHDAVVTGLRGVDRGVQEAVEHRAVDAAAVRLEPQAEQHRAPGAHLLRRAGGSVPELLDHRAHAPSGVGTHQVGGVQHVRDRLPAHPGALGDGVEGVPRGHAHLRRCAGGGHRTGGVLSARIVIGSIKSRDRSLTPRRAPVKMWPPRRPSRRDRE